MTNQDIATHLQQHARSLTHKRENLYRVRAYRRAAETVLMLPRPVAELPRAALECLPGIGKSLAETITHFVQTGEWCADKRTKSVTLSH